MRILVYEDNLMWSSRLVNSLTKLGHVPVLHKTPIIESADAAIVNLGADAFNPPKLVADLHAQNIKVIGHAGHKEKELLELGKEAGCDILATNSQLTFKLESLLAQVE